MAPTSSGYVASNVNMFDKLMDTLPFSPPAFDIFNVTSSTVAVASASPKPTQITSAVSAEPTAEDYVVLPGPEDVLLFNSSNGLYQQSVTLTARMYPIEATAAKSIWGLPTLIWGILIGTIAILIVILATLFFCCWLQPRTRKLLSASYYATNGSTVSHNSIVPKSATSDSNQLVMPLSIGICPPQYSAPPPPGSNNQQQQQQQQQQICSAGSSSGGIPCHGSNVSPAAVHHGSSKYGSSPQYAAHQQQYHQQQSQSQQYAHHHQCIHHQQQQQQQQQYQAHYAHLQSSQNNQYAAQQQQQTLQQYYNQQQQQMQHQQQLTQYIHPAQQQALQQQQREHQIQQQQQQQHHYHHQQHHHQSQPQPQQKQQKHGQLVHHKSMWAINPLYSSGLISDGSAGSGGQDSRGGDGDEEAGSTSYRTRSLPSWGKNKQRPLSNADDLEELYAKVNFSKKRRNRMRNDEAAIIALCRSRSQNLASLPMADQDAVVVYDERTAL